MTESQTPYNPEHYTITKFHGTQIQAKRGQKVCYSNAKKWMKVDCRKASTFNHNMGMEGEEGEGEEGDNIGIPQERDNTLRPRQVKPQNRHPVHRLNILSQRHRTGNPCSSTQPTLGER